MLQDLYTKPLQDLGPLLAPEYAGILSPAYPDAVLARYLAHQFTVESGHYVAHHAHEAFTGRLLQRSFERIGLPMVQPPGFTILDIGSGAGNSIFPLLDLFPQQHLIASDLSPAMLLALKQALDRSGQAARCTLLQLNAEELDFHDHCIDLVVGIALLHHLIRPDLALAGVARILKPGGVAVFSEPFENGNYLLCQAYQAMLADTRADSIPPAVRDLLQMRIDYVASRQGLDRPEAARAGQDDKWLFTRQMFEKLAQQLGFRQLEIMPLAQKADYLQRRTLALLKLHEQPQSALPDWCLAILARFEQGMSSALRMEMPVEAAVILRK